MAKSKQARYADLIARVQRCSLCPRMQDRRRVLGTSNGNLDAAMLFIAEAPGRLGADRSGKPLYGDRTGRSFEEFLTYAGLSRSSVFVTNAVLCNPRTPGGNNDSPARSEILNCSRFLRQTLEIVRPSYVITLGTTALTSLNTIERHQITLSEGVGKLFSWNGYQVCPLFHPGPRALIWRSRSRQMEDYRILATLLDKSPPVA